MVLCNTIITFALYKASKIVFFLAMKGVQYTAKWSVQKRNKQIKKIRSPQRLRGKEIHMAKFNERLNLARWKRSQNAHKRLSAYHAKRGNKRMSVYHDMCMGEQRRGHILSKKARKYIYDFCTH